MTQGDGSEFDRLSALAERGDSDALYALAKAHFAGEGAGKDARRALELFERAAERGHTLAAFEMGLAWNPIALARAYGHTGDWAKSHEWHLRAAERGHRPSIWIVGHNCDIGLGGGGVPGNVPVDRAAALEWFAKLATGDDRTAISAMIGIAAIAMKQKEKATASLWYAQAAKRGDAYALDCLRTLAAEGISSPIGDDEEVALLEDLLARGQERDLEYALLELGLRHEKGARVPLDRVRAYAYLLLVKESEEAKGRPGKATEGVQRLDRRLSVVERKEAREVAQELRKRKGWGAGGS